MRKIVWVGGVAELPLEAETQIAGHGQNRLTWHLIELFLKLPIARWHLIVDDIGKDRINETGWI